MLKLNKNNYNLLRIIIVIIYTFGFWDFAFISTANLRSYIMLTGTFLRMPIEKDPLFFQANDLKERAEFITLLAVPSIQRE